MTSYVSNPTWFSGRTSKVMVLLFMIYEAKSRHYMYISTVLAIGQKK